MKDALDGHGTLESTQLSRNVSVHDTILSVMRADVLSIVCKITELPKPAGILSQVVIRCERFITYDAEPENWHRRILAHQRKQDGRDEWE